MYSYRPPHVAKQKQDDQHEHTYNSYVRIWDVALKTCQRRWTIGRSGERGSGISVLPAWHDDDDIYVYIHIHICVCACVQSNDEKNWPLYTHTRAHTHTNIYIYIYIYNLVGWLVSWLNDNNFRWQFDIKGILVEEKWYYLIHSWVGKGASYLSQAY